MRSLLYILQKTIPASFGVVCITFFVLRLLPGNPVDLLNGEALTNFDTIHLKTSLGLNDPITLQFYKFIKNLFHFNLGTSITQNQSVLQLIFKCLPNTIILAISVFVLSLTFGVLLGSINAYYPNHILCRSLQKLQTLFLSLPSFWIAPLLIFSFSLHWPWLPISEFQSLRALILPTTTLSIGMIALLSRVTVTSLQLQIHADYAVTARAKGLSEIKVLIFHILPNVLTPILTYSTLQLGHLLSGVVITEAIFNWPGIGTLLYNAILQRDYPVIQGVSLWIAVCFIFLHTAADLIHYRFNPHAECLT